MDIDGSKSIVLPKKEDVEVHQKKKQEYRLVGSIKRIDGHTMFSYNKITGEIKEAILEKYDTVTFYGKPIYPNRIKVEPHCYYDQALNKKNFIKRLKRSGMLINKKVKL